MASRSNQGTGGDVTRLDTKSFTDAIAAFNNHLDTFRGVVARANSTTAGITDQSIWRGQGRNAFNDNRTQVVLNLNDICDSITEMRDALVNAHSEYAAADSEVGDAFRQ